MKLVVLALGLGLGCGHSPAPAAVTRVTDDHAASVTAKLETSSEEVTFRAGPRDVPGTIVAPKSPGHWPAVILLAGSGPTDRDWTSPLIPTKNGSGKLLAEQLASHGVVVLRFDKAAVAKNPGPALADFTLDTYREEVLAAIELVRARSNVRADHVFLAGHSEGGMHATRAALIAKPPVAGVIFLSSISRTMADTLLTQLEGNLRNPLAGLSEAQITAEMTSLRAALTDFLAGKPVDWKAASTIPQLQQLVAALLTPTTIQLTRPLLGFDTALEARGLTMPVLVVNGGKDVQVDPDLDGRRLEQSLRDAKRDVTFHLSPDANHVLKHEPLSMVELRADLLAVQNAYNAEDRILDADVVTTIVGWLASR